MIKVTLHMSKDTKGTVVYQEPGFMEQQDKQIPSLYIRKSAMQEAFGLRADWPNTVTVTVESAD